MRIQLLSDLHLETEPFEPQPAPGAEILLLAGDICSQWQGYDLFRDWPVPVLAIPGNHEFDQRELQDALPALRVHCEQRGIRLLERDSIVLPDSSGKRIRFLGTVRWSDFDLFGPADRKRAIRAATYYVKIMRATRAGETFDAAAVREEALACRAWLEAALADNATDAAKPWDTTVVVTHYAPSLRSADPRYGKQPGTASFCNADDDLLPAAKLWIHGHLHCRHDYNVAHGLGQTRVVSNARGHVYKGEAEGFDPLFTIDC